MRYTDEDVLSNEEVLELISKMGEGESDKDNIKRLINSPNFWQAVTCYIVEKELRALINPLFLIFGVLSGFSSVFLVSAISTKSNFFI